MKTFIRIEHPDTKQGPFQSVIDGSKTYYDDSLSEMISRHSNHAPGMPSPAYDKGIGNAWYNHDYLSAYKSVDDLHHWVSNTDLLGLKKLGFGIYLVDVEDGGYIVGEHQAVFEREKSTKGNNIIDDLVAHRAIFADTGILSESVSL